MTTVEYLNAILAKNTLAIEGTELKELRAKRDEIEKVLRDAFGNDPIIKYGGSKAKGTMVLVAYDLDLLCYFLCDEDDAGGTLQELYESVAKALEDAGYSVDKRRSALRVKSSDGTDFHVDVVPGRYVDKEQQDVFLHQNAGDKQRLKTNPDVHIEHVRDSGCIEEIRLAKIWRERECMHTKTFVLELAVIEILADVEGDLEDRMRTLFEAFRDRIDDVVVSDPANGNNDLSALFDDTVRAELVDGARRALDSIDADHWEQVFGSPDLKSEKANYGQAVRRAAAAISIPTKPWSP
jgi:hypothetical protein